MRTTGEKTDRQTERNRKQDKDSEIYIKTERQTDRQRKGKTKQRPNFGDPTPKQKTGFMLCRIQNKICLSVSENHPSSGGE